MQKSKARNRFGTPLILAAVVLFATAAAVGLSRTDAQDGQSLAAASGTLTIDGDNADWASIAGLDVVLKQFEIPAGSEWEIDGEVAPIDSVLKVATDATHLYMLVEVDAPFDFNLEDHHLSPALGVMFQMDSAAGPHMGAADDDFETGLGMVDIWHWELDCVAGAMSGGGDAGSGDDPDCNLDDEYATDPEEREDDDQSGAENSIAGSWSHTATEAGAAGTWIFEMSRPLNTGDATDAQLAAGGTASVALAYWAADETAAGWSDAGHLTSADLGWLEVSLPAATGGPAVPPVGTGLASDSSGSGTLFTLVIGAAVVMLLLGVSLSVVGARRKA